MSTADSLRLSPDYSSSLERYCWFLVLIGFLSQIDTKYSFPSYNISLGFWGVYCSISKHGKATFGLVIFSMFACLLDLVFFFHNEGDSNSYRFALSMQILGLFIKVLIIYVSSKFFSSIGGANSLHDTFESESIHYSPLAGSTSSFNSRPMNNSNVFVAPRANVTDSGNLA